jgi:hypothetical protein
MPASDPLSQRPPSATSTQGDHPLHPPLGHLLSACIATATPEPPARQESRPMASPPVRGLQRSPTVCSPPIEGHTVRTSVLTAKTSQDVPPGIDAPSAIPSTWKLPAGGAHPRRCEPGPAGTGDLAIAPDDAEVPASPTSERGRSFIAPACVNAWDESRTFWDVFKDVLGRFGTSWDEYLQIVTFSTRPRTSPIRASRGFRSSLATIRSVVNELTEGDVPQSAFHQATQRLW